MLPSTDNIKLIKIDKMEENQILKFLLEGCVGGYSLNTLFDFNLKNWDKSMLEYPNGIPQNHQGLLAGLFFNIGVFEDGRIKYMVMYVNAQHKVKKIIFDKKAIQLKRVLLNDVVEFLNRNKIEWRFTSVFEKVLLLHIIQSNVELVFSYDDEERDINLIIIQTPPRFS
jgi:hypothetical protein